MADRTAGGFSDGWRTAPRWELDWVLNLIAPKETCCYDTKLTYCRYSPPQAGFDILCRTRLKGRSSDNQYRLAFPGSPVKTKVQESKGASYL
jgi:hypothetical protein